MNDRAIKFYNSMTELKSDEPILVKNTSGALSFHQMSTNISVPYIRCWYFIDKGFKYGVLTPQGYIKLMDQLSSLITDDCMSESMYGMRIKKYGTEFYKLFNGLDNPQRFINLEYVTLTNKFWVKMYLRLFSDYSRSLLKVINNGSKSKSSKSIQNS